MQPYSMGVVEVFVGDLSKWMGRAMLLFAVAATVWRQALTPDGFVGGLLAGATAIVGAVLMLGGGGVRQNRAALDIGFVLWALLALGWLGRGLLPFDAMGLSVGGVLTVSAGLAWVARRHAVNTRYSPRFFSGRQFETMVQLADVMIHRVGVSDDQPIRVAADTDRELAERADIRPGQVWGGFFLLEWVAPLLMGLPIPFSDLGTHTRRRILRRAARRSRIFQPVATCLTIITNTQRMQALRERANPGSK
jgi:hypothetical protein